VQNRAGPYPYNGWRNVPPSQQSLASKKDVIGEPGYDYSVYDFSNKNMGIQKDAEKQ
jgi:hypothetical protein